MIFDELPMATKASIIKSCVMEGIYKLDDIKTAYNNFVEGRNIYEGLSKISDAADKFGRFLSSGGNLYDGKSSTTQQMKIHKPYYDADGSLYYNITMPEVIVTPEKRKSVYIGDTRSDTSREGYHEGRIPFGAGNASNTAGLWDLLNYNVTGNPNLITGEPPIPTMGKIIPSRTNVTENLLKWIGRPLTHKPRLPLSKAPVERLAYETKEGTNIEKYPGIARMLDLWESKGVDLSRIGVEDLDDIYKFRQANLMVDAPSRYTRANQQGSNYTLTDYSNGVPVGRTDLYIDDSDNLFMSNIKNFTNKYPETDPRKVHDVQRRGLNAAIAVAKSEGKNGVISGNYLQSAPKQYPAIFEHPERIVVSNKGLHTNENIVPPGEYGMFGGWEGPAEATSVEELWANGDKTAMQLSNAPVWQLTKQSSPTPTKSDVFDPTIIDENGKMHTDWGSINIFRSLLTPTVLGASLYNKSDKKK